MYESVTRRAFFFHVGLSVLILGKLRSQSIAKADIEY